jgi:putative membrane protein
MTAFIPGFADQPHPAEPARAPQPTGATDPSPIAPGFIETTSRPPDEVPFQPRAIAVSGTRSGPPGMLTWVAAGLALLVVGGTILSLIGFVVDQTARSVTLGMVTAGVFTVAAAAIVWGALIEVRSYRRLTVVDRMRVRLRDPACPVEDARRFARGWLVGIAARVPEADALQSALDACRTTEEIRALLRHRPLRVLREKARLLGTRAGTQAGFIVAITPSPALDGLIAGLRSLSLIREVAALYGLRPGPAVTIGLMRRCAWTAASVYGVNVAASMAATNLMTEMPVLRHVAAAVPGAGLTATRLYWLSLAVAEACAPVETEV